MFQRPKRVMSPGVSAWRRRACELSHPCPGDRTLLASVPRYAGMQPAPYTCPSVRILAPVTPGRKSYDAHHKHVPVVLSFEMSFLGISFSSAEFQQHTQQSSHPRQPLAAWSLLSSPAGPQNAAPCKRATQLIEANIPFISNNTFDNYSLS
ncbi:hypothetical protein E2C01_055124 [Portunus trituberculatus]|uniref:Uncharacterized protein n=1 Tax=Portunus trituberculatus TaxID=210409 RepID=A0A5B7GLS3_PORTR|nr:hypothetical protein [Portunus trituberculatus]